MRSCKMSEKCGMSCFAKRGYASMWILRENTRWNEVKYWCAEKALGGLEPKMVKGQGETKMMRNGNV